MDSEIEPHSDDRGAPLSRVVALVPSEGEPEQTAWLAALGRAVERRGGRFERLVLDPLDRPTPERRWKRHGELLRALTRCSAVLVVDVERIPTEVLAAAAACPGWLHLRPCLEPPVEPGRGFDPNQPVPNQRVPAPGGELRRGLAKSLTVGLDPIDPRLDAATVAERLASPPTARPRPVDLDLLAATFAVEEQYRRLADWSRDLAEHAADLEQPRGLASLARRARRRARRFLRKRGLR
ncbi:MAG: hypothetical protein AAFZ65_11280 [Planctomycetota bacterium]